jgi:predicted  nucleic acid-binding Zn-ribbon protein
MERLQFTAIKRTEGGFVNPEIAALVDVQTDDLAISELERGIDQLMPKVNALVAEVTKAKGAVDQAIQLVEAEEKRKRDVHGRIEAHKQLQAKNEGVYSAATNQREATAAQAQLEQIKKVIGDEERELIGITQRISEIKVLVEDRQARMAELEQERDAAKEAIAGERTKLEAELNSIRSRRNDRAGKVGRPLISLYDRIRSKKRVHAIFPLRGNSCSNCDTAIPMQRQAQMTSSGKPEVCEGCGVLLYATE